MHRRWQANGTPRKAELTPLIDVIFLLLIFFLVTMRIIPNTSGQGLHEGIYPIKALTKNDQSSGYAVVVLKWLRGPDGNSRTYYLAVVSRPAEGRLSRSQLWTGIQKAKLASEIATLRKNSPFEFYWGPTAADVSRGFQDVSAMIVIAGPDNGHTFTFGEVNEIVRYCKRPGNNVDKWFISPVSVSRYDYPEAFRFENLPLRRVYKPW